MARAKTIRTEAVASAQSAYEALPLDRGSGWCFFGDENCGLQLLHTPLEVVGATDLVHPEQLYEVDVSHQLNQQAARHRSRQGHG